MLLTTVCRSTEIRLQSKNRVKSFRPRTPPEMRRAATKTMVKPLRPAWQQRLEIDNLPGTKGRRIWTLVGNDQSDSYETSREGGQEGQGCTGYTESKALERSKNTAQIDLLHSRVFSQ